MSNLAFKCFDLGRAWYGLSRGCVVPTKFDIYAVLLY